MNYKCMNYKRNRRSKSAWFMSLSFKMLCRSAHISSGSNQSQQSNFRIINFSPEIRNSVHATQFLFLGMYIFRISKNFAVTITPRDPLPFKKLRNFEYLRTSIVFELVQENGRWVFDFMDFYTYSRLYGDNSLLLRPSVAWSGLFYSPSICICK